MRAFVVPAIALLLTGCTTTSHMDTPSVEKPSGKPVTVRASQAGVGQALAYIYGREKKADADIAHVLTMDELGAHSEQHR